MLYVVHMDNGHGVWGWAKVVPSKGGAMQFARAYAAPDHKVVIYLTAKAAHTYTDYDATQFVVVCQQDSFYVGA